MTKNKLDVPTFEQFKNSLPKTFSYSFSLWPFSQRSALVKPKLAKVIDGDYIKDIEYTADISWLSYIFTDPACVYDVSYTFEEVGQRLISEINHYLEDIE